MVIQSHTGWRPSVTRPAALLQSLACCINPSMPQPNTAPAHPARPPTHLVLFVVQEQGLPDVIGVHQEQEDNILICRQAGSQAGSKVLRAGPEAQGWLQ